MATFSAVRKRIPDNGCPCRYSGEDYCHPDDPDKKKKRHSFGLRANSLETFAMTIFAVVCGMSSNFNASTPTADMEIMNINWSQPYGNDEVFVFVAAEYETPRNSFNQVSLWDGIIPSKEHAKFQIRTPIKYWLVDQGSNLRGKEFNLTLHWHVMTKTGKMFVNKIVKTGYHLPDNYR